MIRLQRSTASLAAVALLVCIAMSSFSATYNITVNGNTKQGTVPHFWSRCVGTGGAQLCLRKEWKEAAKIGVKEAGFQAFRGHRILSASNPLIWNGSGTPSYNWTTFDQIYDFLVDSLGTVPVVELSAQPKALETSGEWSPPNNLSVYRDMIEKVVAHCLERYGKERVSKWYWEVWNEWDYTGFWSKGTEQQYYEMYKYAVEGATKAFPDVKIGGPSTTGSHALRDFLNYCKSNNIKVDFVSNHAYGGGASGPNADPVVERDDNRRRSDEIKNFGKKLVSMNTEFNSSYEGQGGKTGANCYSMDNHINAPYVVKCIKLILDDHTAGTHQLPEVFSYWVISDVFDEGSYIENHNMVPFGQVFGLINYQGIRKATFNAFKLLHMMGTIRLSLTGGTGDADGVDGFATINEEGTQVAVIIYNFYKVLSITGTDEVNLTVNNLPFPQGEVEVRHYRIDETHSNPYSVWVNQGKPVKPTNAQWDEMRAASELAELNPKKTINYSGTAYIENFTLPRQSVSMLLFKSTSGTSIKKSINTIQSVGPAKSLSFSDGVVTVSNEKEPAYIYVFGIDGKLLNKYSIIKKSLDVRKLVKGEGVCLVEAHCGTERIIGKLGKVR